MKNFKTFGVMIDMSRNAVMSMEGLRRFLPLLAKMGYNCVMLYTEDTYEVDGEPYFGYMRGRYTKEEMKEIDSFAASLGMEVIPCIQTLAHLNTALRWGKYPVDCNDILLCDDERTYELIDHMFATLSECFSSRKIHIGMDEAHMLGRGKHLDRFGYETPDKIIARHLGRVCELAEKYGYEPLMWSDMFFRPWNGGAYHIPRTKIPDSFIAACPLSVTPVYWDYYQTSEDKYAAMMENHSQFPREPWFAGGAWCWTGFIPQNDFTLEAMLPAINACRKNKVKHVFFTMWGDDGGECSHFSQLPSLLYLAEYAKGNTDEQKIKKKFRSLVGMEYDDFIKIDLPNKILPKVSGPVNPSKYMLYSDYFNDFLDYTVIRGEGKTYEKYAAELHILAKRSRRYGYVFDTAAKLCDILALKYELGLRTREAYGAGDKTALRALAEGEYTKLLKLIDIFARAFEKQWLADNKPHGFDVQDMRLGGLIRRTDACRRRLLDYASGKLDSIPELEEKLLPFGHESESMRINKALGYSTVNLIHHGQWAY